MISWKIYFALLKSFALTFLILLRNPWDHLFWGDRRKRRKHCSFFSVKNVWVFFQFLLPLERESPFGILLEKKKLQKSCGKWREQCSSWSAVEYSHPEKKLEFSFPFFSFPKQALTVLTECLQSCYSTWLWKAMMYNKDVPKRVFVE